MSQQDQNSQTQEFSLKQLFVPLTTLKAIHWIVIIGFVVFANMLFNGFVGDDTGQIISNISVHSAVNIPEIFFNKIQAREISNYYRPVPYAVYSLIYTFFQANSFFYHTIQLFFYIANSILLFLILKKFLKQWIAFFLVLLFLVIPINEETVAYIANLQDILFVFFGLLSLYLLQSNSQKIKFIIFANLSLLFSFFSKESGLLFFAITILYVYFFKKSKLLYQIIFSLCVLFLYIVFRLVNAIPLSKAALVPIMNASLWERIINIPAIIFYYISTLIYPKDLVIIHSWIIHSINFNNFYLPLFIDIVFFICLLYIVFFLYKKGLGKYSLFFLSWFLLGLLIHLQIFPIDQTVADHYFYFPLIGLLALLGLYINSIKISRSGRNIFIAVIIVILVIFSIRTVIRNSNWIDQSTLISHDAQIEKNDYLMELLYSTDLMQRQRFKEALPHIQKAISLYPQSWLAWSSLGVTYMEMGKYFQAKQAYIYSMALGRYYGSYENMALLLLNHDSLQNAIHFIKKANKVYPNSEKLWYYRIIASYKLKDTDDAIYAAKHYFLLKQNQESYTILYYLQHNLPINIDIGS